MAIVYRATISPTKLELVSRWVEASGALPGHGELRQVGSYRFDDPDGEVGVEALLVTRGGPVVHVPLTYRGAPLPDGEEHLIGTMEHSVLGRRWIYDAAGDPVALAAFGRALADVQEQARLEIWDGDEHVETRPQTVALEVRDPASSPAAVRPRLVTGPEVDSGPGVAVLVARWDGGESIVAVGDPA